VVLEVGWVAAHLAMYPVGLVSGPVRRATNEPYTLRNLSPHQRGLVHHAIEAAGTPILLVHGIVDNHSIFTVLDRALRRRGFSDVSSFDYSLLTSDVREAARDLATAVEALSAASGYERVHVIGHSLGGLIARYYIQCLGGHQRVHTCVTLGTPHQGTLIARPARWLRLPGQLAPGSELLQDLAAPAPLCTTRFIAFYSDIDHLIVPSRNASIEHPDLVARNVAVHGVGHMSLPNNGRIAFQISAALRDLDPDGTDPRSSVSAIPTNEGVPG
jgi:triacylglycerol lipase